MPHAKVVHWIELGTTVASGKARAASGRIALIVGVTDLLADVAYVLAVAIPLDDVAGLVVASLVGPLIACASVAATSSSHRSERLLRVSSRPSPTSPRERS